MGDINKKNIIISGINMTEGGILTILEELLVYMDRFPESSYTIVALVNNKKKFENLTKNIKYEEYPLSKKNWLFRIFYEYFYFYFYSKKRNIDIWLSMHDMTPNVVAKKLITYCHNATPFYNMTLKESIYDKKLYLFSKFYKYLYRINIKKNLYIVVQQNWIKQEFEKMYNLSNVIVNRPSIDPCNINYLKIEKTNKISFFYPSIPRVFKNFELICEAAMKLEKRGIKNIEFILTIGKNMNKYGDFIYEKYKKVKLLKFVGYLKREEVFTYYDYCDALIFPSKLETCGLPLIEFKSFKKKIIVSDLLYARENLTDYDLVSFFNPYSVESLEDEVIRFINNKFETSKYLEKSEGWEMLFENYLEEKKK